MPGTPVNITTVNNKLQQRWDILNPVLPGGKKLLTDFLLPALKSAGLPAAPAATFYNVIKNAYVFDIGLISRYFAEAAISSNYTGLSHLLVIEAAHDADATIGGTDFKKNQPTVIIVPVRHLGGESYKMVGNPEDASGEWPDTFTAQKGSLNLAMVAAVKKDEEDLIFSVFPAVSTAPDDSMPDDRDKAEES